MVLIDAAKGCTTEPPNLTVYPADFVVCSFYKVTHMQPLFIFYFF
jgi:molybdenum cofactor sulfurtransferase